MSRQYPNQNQKQPSQSTRQKYPNLKQFEYLNNSTYTPLTEFANAASASKNQKKSDQKIYVSTVQAQQLQPVQKDAGSSFFGFLNLHRLLFKSEDKVQGSSSIGSVAYKINQGEEISTAKDVVFGSSYDKKITYYAKPAEPVNEKVDEKTTEVQVITKVQIKELSKQQIWKQKLIEIQQEKQRIALQKKQRERLRKQQNERIQKQKARLKAQRFEQQRIQIERVKIQRQRQIQIQKQRKKQKQILKQRIQQERQKQIQILKIKQKQGQERKQKQRREAQIEKEKKWLQQVEVERQKQKQKQIQIQKQKQRLRIINEQHARQQEQKTKNEQQRRRIWQEKHEKQRQNLLRKKQQIAQLKRELLEDIYQQQKRSKQNQQTNNKLYEKFKRTHKPQQRQQQVKQVATEQVKRTQKIIIQEPTIPMIKIVESEISQQQQPQPQPQPQQQYQQQSYTSIPGFTQTDTAIILSSPQIAQQPIQSVIVPPLQLQSQIITQSGVIVPSTTIIKLQPPAAQTLPPQQQKSIRNTIQFIGRQFILQVPRFLSQQKQQLQQTQSYKQLIYNIQQYKKQYYYPVKTLYTTLPKRMTEIKYQFIEGYTFNQRIIVLNAMAAIIAAATLRINRARPFVGVMRMIRNTAFGYLLGAAVLTPEMYYRRMKDKINVDQL